jgi:hypothetical protein
MHNSDFAQIEPSNQIAMDREAEQDWQNRHNARDIFKKMREADKKMNKEYDWIDFSLTSLIVIIIFSYWAYCFFSVI